MTKTLYFLKIIEVIFLVQLICFNILNIEGRPNNNSNKKSDFIFPGGQDFIFPNDEKLNLIDHKHHEYHDSIEYNICKEKHQTQRHYNRVICKQFSNTKNGEWWHPKPENYSGSPPGYSGFLSHSWKHHIHSSESKGEHERAKSELRYKEYIDSIFGKGDYDEHTILTPEELNGREIADPGQFPHVAAIGFRLPDREKVWQCAGSLLSEHFVLTAAHCTDFGGQPPNFVKLGDINLNIREEVVATQRFRISQIFVHPNYTSNLYYHDIALLKLSKPAVFTRHVYPIRLWANRDVPFLLAFAMGYGATQFGKISTGVLSYLNFTLIGNKECNESMSNVEETPYGIIDSQICAINSINSADICQGDSGGPLQLHLPGSKRPSYFLIGITSFGSICGSGLPGVYTRVHSYLEWIENIVWPD